MEQVVDESADGWNAGGFTDEDDFINLLGRDAGGGEGLLAGARGAVENRLNELLEDVAGNLTLITVAVGEFEIEVRGLLGGESDLGVDCGLAQGLHRAGMLTEIDAVFR